MLKNSVGVVDASYRGEIMFRFYGINSIKYNEGNEKRIIFSEDKYVIGDRVGQIVFMELPKVDLIQAAGLTDTERGTAGYGSTGDK